MIKLLRKVPRDERAVLASYLAKTPVRHWAAREFRKRRPLHHGIVPTVTDLGNLETIFQDLGRRKPGRGRKRFLVRHAYRAFLRGMKRHHHTRKLNAYIRMLTRDEPLQVIVTIGRTDHGDIIADGNARSIAYYEAMRRRKLESVPLPVYVLDVRKKRRA